MPPVELVQAVSPAGLVSSGSAPGHARQQRLAELGCAQPSLSTTLSVLAPTGLSAPFQISERIPQKV